MADPTPAPNTAPVTAAPAPVAASAAPAPAPAAPTATPTAPSTDLLGGNATAAPATAPATPPVAAPAAPAALAIKAPQGFDAKAVEAFTAEATTKKWAPEVAQTIFDERLALANGIKAQTDQAQTAFNAEVEGWKKSIAEDKEFGGEKFNQTVSAANSALTKADPTGELTKILKDSGYANHPGVIKAFARIAAAGFGDAIVGTPPGSPPDASEQDMLYARYPSMRPKA